MKAKRRLRGFPWTLAALPALWVAATVAAPAVIFAAGPLPIFDSHLHYSQESWEEFPPAVVMRKLRNAGVSWALVSSTPDEGTLKLTGRDRKRFIPELRPYRGQVGAGNWADDGATPAYLAGRLQTGVYKGIGEFHLLSGEDAGKPVLREVARMALQRNILLHVHAGAEPVRKLFSLQPKLRILWAHAGMTTPPDEIRRMLEAHPNLWADVSFRGGDILQGNVLHPAWEILLLAHKDRFMIGSDTYANSRWEAYEALIARHRKWLALLPPAAAKAIAHGNALRVLGVKLVR